MRPMIIGFAIAAALALPRQAQATDWGHLYAYVDWTNDYRFYGASESGRQPAVQGGLHWMGPENFYAGLFVSSVDFHDYRNTSTETDFYAGRHFLFDDNDLNVELLYGIYPDSAGHPTYLPPDTILPGYNFPEAMAEFTHKFGALSLGGKILGEPRPDSHGGFLWSLTGEGSYAITDWLKASVDVGHQWASRGPRGFYWDAGLTANYTWQWAFDVRYYDTGISNARCFGTNWCRAAAVAKITYTFAVF